MEPVSQANYNLGSMSEYIAPVCREEGCHGRQLSAVCSWATVSAPPTWQGWAPEGGSSRVHPRCCDPDGSTTDEFRAPNLFEHGFEQYAVDAVITYHAQPILTCRCQMGDNCITDVCFLPRGDNLISYSELPLQPQLYLVRRQALSKKRSRTARPNKIRRCGNTSSSVSV